MEQKYDVGYGTLDAFKRAAQAAARATDSNIERLGLKVVEWTRGESVFLIEHPLFYLGHVNEGLGTKNIVADDYALDAALADDVSEGIGSSYYANIAQCTVAMGVNDIITLGVTPTIVAMHLAVENAQYWFRRGNRADELVQGWKDACNSARCVWGPGETPALRDLVAPGKALLSCSVEGIILKKDRLIRRDIRDGDVILILESSGIHANGLTFARDLAKNLRQGYLTKISGGQRFGEALLTPTHIYSGFVEDCLDVGIKIHYGVNITGHGWRKFMRAPESFEYEIDHVPKPLPVFDFLEREGKVSRRNMYADFNMGAGFALYLSQEDAVRAQRMLMTGAYPFGGFIAGRIKKASKSRVLIRPEHIEFTADELEVR